MVIPFYKKLNPIWWLGNADDGLCGERDPNMRWWRARECPNGCTLLCKLKWFIRNPLHNFMFYVIGFADRGVSHSDKFWPQNGRKTIFLIRKVNGLPIWLPWFAFKTKSWKGYIGWRDRGHFGIACRRYHG